MSDEAGMKRALQAYIDHFNASDPAAIAGLYADDATVEESFARTRALLKDVHTG